MIEESIRVYKNLAEAKMKDCEAYKIRIDKTIGFINTACSWLNIDLRDNDELLEVKVRFFKELLNILEGSDDNE